MKKLNVVMVSLLFTFVVTAVSTAGMVTNLPNWSSQAKLRAAVIENSRTVMVRCASNSEMSNATVSSTILPDQHSSIDIVRAAMNTPGPLTVANSNDWVYVDVQVLDQYGQGLMYGGKSAKPVVGPDGNHVLPEIKIELELAWSIPVKIDQPVTYAEVWYVDPKTKQTIFREQMYSYGSMVYLRKQAAGAGFLVLNMEDGTRRYYDLTSQDGGMVDGVDIDISVNSVGIRNLQHYIDPAVIDGSLWSWNGVGENQTFETEMNQAGTFNVSVKTTEGASPVGVWIRKQGSKDWDYKDGGGASDIPVYLEPGTWYIVPAWDENQFREADPASPYGQQKG